MSSAKVNTAANFSRGGGSDGTMDKLRRMNRLPQIDDHIKFYENVVVDERGVPREEIALDSHGEFVDAAYELPEGWRKLNHKYFVDGEMMEESLTSFIHHFHAPFDDIKESTRLAREAKPGSKYFGKTRDEILQVWAERRWRGQDMHAYLEAFYNDCHDPNDARAKDPSFAHFLRFHQEFVIGNDLVPFRTELRNFDFYEYSSTGLAATRQSFRKHKLLCGTADMLYIRRVDIGHPERGCNVILVDWKFLNKMWTQGFGGAKMYAPFQDLDDCNLCHYQVQLNGYWYMAERQTPLVVTEAYIADFGEDNPIYMLYPVCNLQKEIRVAIQMRREEHLRTTLLRRESVLHELLDEVVLQRQADELSANAEKRLRAKINEIWKVDLDALPFIEELRGKQRRTLHAECEESEKLQTNIADFFAPKKRAKK